MVKINEVYTVFCLYQYDEHIRPFRDGYYGSTDCTPYSIKPLFVRVPHSPIALTPDCFTLRARRKFSRRHRANQRPGIHQPDRDEGFTASLYLWASPRPSVSSLYPALRIFVCVVARDRTFRAVFLRVLSRNLIIFWSIFWSFFDHFSIVSCSCDELKVFCIMYCFLV